MPIYSIDKKLQKPYSGRFLLRINLALHAQLAMKAQVNGMSLNQYAAGVLAQT
ncbi:MAG: toxin-antitoxin system HicB family antitoxin [Pseudomonadota bacterium]